MQCYNKLKPWSRNPSQNQILKSTIVLIVLVIRPKQVFLKILQIRWKTTVLELRFDKVVGFKRADFLKSDFFILEWV